MVAQVLPQDWALATFCWPGWQDQDVGCEWQRQMHENVHGLHKGICPCFICAALCTTCRLQSSCHLAAQADIAHGVKKELPSFQMSVAYVLLQMIAAAVNVSRICLATNAELVCECVRACALSEVCLKGKSIVV